MSLLNRSLPLWIALIVLATCSATLADRTPPPPGSQPHRAPPAHSGAHKAPPAHPGTHKAPPAHPPKQPGAKKPGPGKHPGELPGKHPGNQPGKKPGNHPGKHPGGHLGKPWWSGPHPDHHPHHPVHPHHDPDWRPRPMPMPIVPMVEPAFGPLELLNENDVTLQCRINGKVVVLQPGRVLPLEPGRVWTIEFHRGGPFGIARYELVDGIHKFVRAERGWELIRVGHEPPPHEPEFEIPANPLAY
ncbi:MAG: hypothetical protein JW888_07730 [Pirellulales bacterium]|nr:hypothetical protein [Pirellulales bacterium]